MAGLPQQFRKWRRLLKRIEQEQLHDLLVNQNLFRQLVERLRHHVGSTEHADLAEWIIQGHVAFATTAIRRLRERPSRNWRSISLRILLEELANNASELTRERFVSMYRESDRGRFADRAFDKLAGRRGLACLEPERIKEDIRRLEATCKPINRLVNKVVAHTEADRRKIGRLTYGDLGTAITEVVTVYQKYALLLTGRVCDLVPLDGYDISDTLDRLWPRP